MQPTSGPASLVRRAIRSLDAYLCRRSGIKVFSDDPNCLLRISLAQARQPMVLSDTRIEPGERLLVIHFWNDRLQVPATGIDLRWVRRTFQRFALSFRLLSQYMAEHPEEYGAVRAVGGEAGYLSLDQHETMASVAGRLGLEVVAQAPRGAWERFLAFWPRVHGWGLLWAFNPQAARGKTPWNMAHQSLWMSRAKLDRIYGRPQGKPASDRQPEEMGRPEAQAVH